MSRSRRYRLLCPIARGLDHVGDRWTLAAAARPACRAGPVHRSAVGTAGTGLQPVDRPAP